MIKDICACVLVSLKGASQQFETVIFITVILTAVGPAVGESVLDYKAVNVIAWQSVTATITAPVKYVNDA